MSHCETCKNKRYFNDEYGKIYYCKLSKKILPNPLKSVCISYSKRDENYTENKIIFRNIKELQRWAAFILEWTNGLVEDIAIENEVMIEHDIRRLKMMNIYIEDLKTKNKRLYQVYPITKGLNPPIFNGEPIKKEDIEKAVKKLEKEGFFKKEGE